MSDRARETTAEETRSSSHAPKSSDSDQENKAKSLVHQADASGVQQNVSGDDVAAPAARRLGLGLSVLSGLFGCCSASDDVERTGARRRRIVAKRSDLNAPLLRKKKEKDQEERKTLFLDLDETLVHSTFQQTDDADIVLPIEIEGTTYRVFVRKRPGATWFIDEMSKHFEVVVYTASLQKYADPLLDIIDKHGNVSERLFRRHCTMHRGGYVKDLSRMDRDLSSLLLVDNSPLSYQLQPHNGVPCSSFIDDRKDRELYELAPYLVALAGVDDVRRHTYKWKARFAALYAKR